MARSLEARSRRFAGPRLYNVHEPARCASRVPQACLATSRPGLEPWPALHRRNSGSRRETRIQARSSATTPPSANWMRRPMRAARPRSWVTAMTVLPRRATRSRRISNTCSLDFESSGQVGSSARISGGSLASARDRDALALAAGELVRTFRRVLAQAKRGEQRIGALLHLPWRQPAERPHRQHDVLPRREFRQQEMELEHEADRRLAGRGTLVLVHGGSGAAAAPHLTGGRYVEQAEKDRAATTFPTPTDP